MRRAFTRIDLVVVTASAAVLVPLLVPVLRDADRQAGVAECLNNLRQVMQATGAYLSDYDNKYPFLTSSGSGMASWVFGGKTNDEAWIGDIYYIRVTDRPLNPYLLGGVVQPDVMDGSLVVARTPVPPLYCPADRFSHQRLNWGGNDPNQIPPAISCYDDVGTSYQYNLLAFLDMGTYQGPVILSWSLIRAVLNGQADSFTFYLEDPMDWGLAFNVLQTGNHGELGKHSCGYLDGHADYAYRDTRGWCGVGWEAIVSDWVRYMGCTPPISYRAWKNCDPR